MKNTIINLGFSSREAEELLKVSENIESDIEKLKSNYPIQYLIGYVDFYGNKIKVDERVLIPRYETEGLVEKTNMYIKCYLKSDIRILDLCTGSGAISIALKKLNNNYKIDASDISEDAINVARENAINNKVALNIIESDLFKNITNKYDVIISNPPYISYDERIDDSVRLFEPGIALYADNNGLEFYEKIISTSGKYLNKKHILAFEIGYKEGKGILNIAKDYFPKDNIIIEKDLSGNDRYVFIISE